MQSVIIAPLVIAACVLALVGGANSECCQDMKTVQYKISGGDCGDVGGEKSGDSCSIIICGNGEAVVGTYCGKGPCNLFGCACKNGCLQGNWVDDFLAKNSRYSIDIINVH
ncbi:protein Diedel-like [Drosophila kikkawai]|uniref:Protein Diedel-like n=1 Tax=Drosophila kikkawai TaxID=30033 RepID=A0A6P4IDW9_DROKI|nr:protein Diedel-like [Drosophila kikkawai]